MPSVYDSDAFAQRVNYAAACFMRGTRSTRHFDTCFEMYDGDFVVAALVRRANKNPKLYTAIARMFSGTFPEGWNKTAAKYAGIPRDKLADAAKDYRADMKARHGT